MKHVFINIMIKTISLHKSRRIKSSSGFLIKNETLYIYETSLLFVYSEELINLVIL
jgi:hypothetical protein